MVGVFYLFFFFEVIFLDVGFVEKFVFLRVVGLFSIFFDFFLNWDEVFGRLSKEVKSVMSGIS